VLVGSDKDGSFLKLSIKVPEIDFLRLLLSDKKVNYRNFKVINGFKR
jgi:hypothetical protein